MMRLLFVPKIIEVFEFGCIVHLIDVSISDDDDGQDDGNDSNGNGQTRFGVYTYPFFQDDAPHIGHDNDECHMEDPGAGAVAGSMAGFFAWSATGKIVEKVWLKRIRRQTEVTEKIEFN